MHCTPVTVERAEAISYGLKEETRVQGPKEDGEKPRAVDRHSLGGQRTKKEWDLVKQCILNGDRNSIPTDLTIKYRLESRMDGLRTFWTVDARRDLPVSLENPWELSLQVKGAETKCRHFWLYSREPNMGKTTWAKTLQVQFKGYIKAGDFSYWTVEGDESVILLDDFNEPMVKYHTLNQMCDGTYEFRVIYKGLKKLNNPLIIILSNFSISDLYKDKSTFLYARFNEYEVQLP